MVNCESEDGMEGGVTVDEAEYDVDTDPSDPRGLGSSSGLKKDQHKSQLRPTFPLESHARPMPILLLLLYPTLHPSDSAHAILAVSKRVKSLTSSWVPW